MSPASSTCVWEKNRLSGICGKSRLFLHTETIFLGSCGDPELAVGRHDYDKCIPGRSSWASGEARPLFPACPFLPHPPRKKDRPGLVPFTIILGLTFRFLFNPTRVLSGVAWKHGALRDGCRRDGEVCSPTSPGPPCETFSFLQGRHCPNLNSSILIWTLVTEKFSPSHSDCLHCI
jgi:hypothetical protein